MTAQQEDIKSMIISEAESLFRKFGYKKTTMDDIAETIRKKKSAIYYYFENKEEIFQAVVEKQADVISQALLKAISKESSPQAKLKCYLLERTRQFIDKANYYQALRSDYLSNMAFVEKARKKFDNLEMAVIKQILDDGVCNGLFKIKDTQLASFAIMTALKSLEIPLIMDKIDKEMHARIDYLIEVLFYGIATRTNENKN